MNPEPKARLLRPDQVGEILNISRSGVYRLVAEGQLVALHVRGSLRILATSIDDYIERQLHVFALETGEPESVSGSPNGPRIPGG